MKIGPVPDLQELKMSKICNLWRLIVVDCNYAESYRRFLSGENADAIADTKA